jgi:ribonuclease T2
VKSAISDRRTRHSRWEGETLNNCRIALVAAFLLSIATHSLSAQQYAKPGKFDLYLFTLSWSPQFCATTKRVTPECRIEKGNFVVHGLWPEFKNGSWPSTCSREPGPSDPASLADLIPDPTLVTHEWSKHGTCSALGVDGYFKLMRSVRESIHIPPLFQQLSQQTWIAPSAIKASFTASNPQLLEDDMRIGCAGNTLVQVQICTDRNGKPTSCGRIRDCRATSIKVLPVLGPAG